jgi:hypothetical protein
LANSTIRRSPAVHVLVLAVLDEGALDLFGGLKPQRQLDPVGNTPHVHLGESSPVPLSFTGADKS